ncbi:tail assembly chaperone E/41/14-like protein [Hydrogenoanaerobacterium saccharovorans]|uniref:Phage tail assembly chaperone protein, E, or 41 or 14 n=1 Tax=Hydrogenoanaerobacterium saccharovorans TaxID=474960 RepID=A0A1H7YIF4_9FIRM|nr:phage tail assembly protein [Hydrogenoanaerobacterium saccharovorans]RPF41914.1 tail assembly chaperone E/41/14-like protein [Hydrogenoanaerobacterium saccharovorans]SEM45723.1 Phage tail assembly chaperone protein, E, or 41 or 14 [Hydrogenoanaerobacterium saccharovorans]
MFGNRTKNEEFDLDEPIEVAEVREEPQEQENILALKKPLKVNGEELKELPFDFEELTAKDLHKISKDLKNRGIPVTVLALDYEYQLSTFAEAVKKVNRDVTMNDILRLSAHDAMKATGLARSFLLAADPASAELGSGE